MTGEPFIEDGMAVGFRRTVFEHSGTERGQEIGAVEKGFRALGQELGGRDGGCEEVGKGEGRCWWWGLRRRDDFCHG